MRQNRGDTAVSFLLGSRILTGALFLLGVPLIGCAAEKYDDAYYAKVHTVRLLPEETKDLKASPPQPPYYQFQIARGYVGGDSLPQSTLLLVEALYPSMERFSLSRREAWYTKTPNGEWGPHVEDVLDIFVKYWLSGENDGTVGIIRRIEREVDSQGRKTFVGAPVPHDLSKNVSTLKFYQYGFNKDGMDRHYIFRQGERTAAVSCLPIMQCKAVTTWKGKLRVHYRFHSNRLSEMAEIDTAVNTLIDSFHPTLIQQGR